MESINIIKNGIHTLINKSGELLPFESMTEQEKHICQNNVKARHLIMCTLSPILFPISVTKSVTNSVTDSVTESMTDSVIESVTEFVTDFFGH